MSKPSLTALPADDGATCADCEGHGYRALPADWVVNGTPLCDACAMPHVARAGEPIPYTEDGPNCAGCEAEGLRDIVAFYRIDGRAFCHDCALAHLAGGATPPPPEIAPQERPQVPSSAITVGPLWQRERLRAADDALDTIARLLSVATAHVNAVAADDWYDAQPPADAAARIFAMLADIVRATGRTVAEPGA